MLLFSGPIPGFTCHRMTCEEAQIIFEREEIYENRKNFWPQMNADERRFGEEKKTFLPQMNADERRFGEER